MIRHFCPSMAPTPLWFPTISSNPSCLSKWRSNDNQSLKTSVSDSVSASSSSIPSYPMDIGDPSESFRLPLDYATPSPVDKRIPLLVETVSQPSLFETEISQPNPTLSSAQSEDSGIYPPPDASPQSVQKKTNYFSLQTADRLISPYQSFPQANFPLYLYSWTLPDPKIVANLAEVDPKCFADSAQKIALVFTKPISEDNYVCRIPLYLTRGLARARIHLVGTITLTPTMLDVITQAHHILAELLTNIANLSHVGLVPSDQSLRKIMFDNLQLGTGALGRLSVRDEFGNLEFNPEASRFLGLVTLINTANNDVDFNAIYSLISWSQARLSWNPQTQSIDSQCLSEIKPISGVLPTFPVRLSQMPQSSWPTLIVRPCQFPDEDPAMFALVECSTKTGMDQISSNLLEKFKESLNSTKSASNSIPTEQNMDFEFTSLSYIDYFAVRNPSINAMLDHINPYLPLAVCNRLTRHQNAAQVNAGMRKSNKSKSRNKVSLFLADACFVYPLSAWLFFLLSTTPVVLYQLTRALAASQLSELLTTQLQYISKPLSVETDCPHTVLVPDRLDNPKCMLSELNHFTEFDRQVHLSTSSEIISVDEEIKSKRLVQNRIAPHAMDLLEPTTLLGAHDAVNLERLELLGDAFLNLMGTLTVFSNSPTTCSEGALTSGRVALISNANLYSIALRLGWARFCIGQVYSPVDHFLFPCYTVKQSEITESNSRLFIRLTDKSLADMMEALIGSFLHILGPVAAFRLVAYFGISPKQPGSWCNLFKAGHNIIEFNNVDVSNNTYPSGIPTMVSRSSELFTSAAVDSNLSATKAELKEELSTRLLGLQTQLGYQFKNIELLIQALMHPSSPYVPLFGSYQRLEFLGDSILSYIITLFLYGKYEDFDPGKLTTSRGNIVSNTSLACTVVEHQLHLHILHNHTLFDNVVASVSSILDKTSCYSEQLELLTEEVLKGSRIKFLADVFESIIGAIFVDTDGNLAIVSDLIMRLLSARLLDYLERNPIHPIRTMHKMHPTLKYTSQGKDDVVGRTDQYQLCATLSGEKILISGSTRNEARLALAHHLQIPMKTITN